MRILTLNCHSLLEYEVNEQIQELVDFVVRESVTIIALQEASQSMKSPILSQTELLGSGFVPPSESDVPVKVDNFAYLLVRALRRVKLNFAWSWTASHVGYDKLDEGIALLSLKPLQAVHAPVIVAKPEFVSYQDYRRRKLLLAKVAGSGNLTIATGHFDGWQAEIFEAEWQQALSHFDLKEPVYLMGDLNVDAEQNDCSYQKICQSFQDTYELAAAKGDGLTVRGAIDGWEDSQVGKRIDYILTTASNEVLSSRVCFDGQDSARISDHAGIIVEVADTPSLATVKKRQHYTA